MMNKEHEQLQKNKKHWKKILLLLFVLITISGIYFSKPQTCQTSKIITLRHDLQVTKKPEKKENSKLSNPKKNQESASTKKASFSQPSVNSSSERNEIRQDVDVSEVKPVETNNSEQNENVSNSSQTVNEHTHHWEVVTKTIHHDEIKHKEKVLAKEAYDSTEPIYEVVNRDICNQCNKDVTDDPEAHYMSEDSQCWRYHTEQKRIQTGTKTIHHDAEYTEKWVIDEEEWDEIVKTGYQCSCGAKKASISF